MQIVVKEAAHTHSKLQLCVGILQLKQPCMSASSCENIFNNHLSASESQEKDMTFVKYTRNPQRQRQNIGIFPPIFFKDKNYTDFTLMEWISGFQEFSYHIARAQSPHVRRR